MAEPSSMVVIEPCQSADNIDDQIQSLTIGYSMQDQHGVQMLKYLNALRKERQLCDVVLMVEGRELFAHQALLSCHSNYFLEYFLENEHAHPNKTQIHCPMDHFEYLPIKLILQFIYEGRFPLTKELVPKIYLTAHRLRMDVLIKSCSNYLIQNLTTENCLSTLLLAIDDDLREKSTEWIKKNFSSVIETREFHLLSTIKFEVIDLNKIKTKPIHELILNWIVEQTRPNKRILSELCDCTHLLYVKGDKLRDCAEMQENHPSFSDIVRDYQSAHQAKRNASAAALTTTQKDNFFIELATFPFYNDQLLSSLKVAETKFIQFNRSGDYGYVGIVLIHGKMLAISVHQPVLINSTPTVSESSNTSSSDKSNSDESSPTLSLNNETPIGSLLTARCCFGTVTNENQIFVIGGYNRGDCLNTIERFDPVTAEWTTFSLSLKSRRGRVASAIIDNRIFVCGGSDGQKELNTSEWFDLKTMENWSMMKALPFCVVHAAMCTDGQFLYLIGGLEGDKCKNDFYRFEPQTDQWISLPSLQQERNQAAAVYFDKKIYVFGGSALNRCLSSCEIFHLSSNRWSFGASMKENRRGCGAILYHDKIFVIGGSNGVTALTTVEIFNPITCEWLVHINSFSHRLNIPRIGLGVGICHDRLYVIGGFDGRHFLKSVEIFDENAQQWSTNRSNLA